MVGFESEMSHIGLYFKCWWSRWEKERFGRLKPLGLGAWLGKCLKAELPGPLCCEETASPAMGQSYPAIPFPLNRAKFF